MRWWEGDLNGYQISALRVRGRAHDIKLPRADGRIKEILPGTPVAQPAAPEMSIAGD